jgi:hypothetical protein
VKRHGAPESVMSVRTIWVGAVLLVCGTGCRKQYINTYNGATKYDVRIVHNCGAGGVATVYFDREYRMKGHITATSHSVMRGHPLTIKLAAGNHRMIVEDGREIYSREFRVTGPLEVISNCSYTR